MLAASNAAAVVPVQRRHLFGEVRADDVQPAISVEIADTHAHAGKSDSILVEGGAGRHGDFPKRPVVIVAIEQARRAVTGDVDIGPTVVVKIC